MLQERQHLIGITPSSIPLLIGRELSMIYHASHLANKRPMRDILTDYAP